MSYKSDPRYHAAISKAKNRGITPGENIPMDIFLSAGFREEEIEISDQRILREHLIEFAKAILIENKESLKLRAHKIALLSGVNAGILEAINKTLGNIE